MKKRIISLLAVLLALALTACGGSTFGTKHVVGESEQFSAREIKAAMKAVESHFRRHFDGCTLLELAYDDALTAREGGEWAEQYGDKEGIVLTSRFYVSPTGGDGSLNQNYTYERWQWVLTKSGIGGWKLQTWGYA